MPEARIIPSTSIERIATEVAVRYDALHRIETAAGAVAASPLHISPPGAIALDLLKPFGGALLDAGCGRGTVAIRAHLGFEYRLGLDFSDYFLEQAVLRANTLGVREGCCIEFMRHNLDNPLPLEDGSFDAVASLACLEHIFDVYGFLSECRRVMKPGAVLIVQVPNIAYARHRLSLLLGRLPVTASSPQLWWRDYWDGTHLHYFTLSSLRMALAQVGLSYQGVTGSGRFRRMRAWRPALLTGDLIVTASKPNAQPTRVHSGIRRHYAGVPCGRPRDAL